MGPRRTTEWERNVSFINDPGFGANGTPDMCTAPIERLQTQANGGCVGAPASCSRTDGVEGQITGNSVDAAGLARIAEVEPEVAQRAGQGHTRLQTAAGRAAGLRRTARSQFPAAAAFALRRPATGNRSRNSKISRDASAIISLV